MALLATGVKTLLHKGMYNIDMEMSAGDARLQISVGGREFKDIDETIYALNANFNLTIPRCAIRSVITGDGTVHITSLEKI